MTPSQRTDYRDFLQQLRTSGLYVQWYDSVTDSGELSYQNEFNAANSPWVTNPEPGRVTDASFLNYWWDQRKLENSAQHAQELGLDPRAAVFTGVEAGKYQFEQPYDLAGNLDADGAPLTAIATLGADFTHADLEGKTDNARQHEARSEEHTSELQSRGHLVCRLPLERTKSYTNPPMRQIGPE